mgnify:CR=1 FL=1
MACKDWNAAEMKHGHIALVSETCPSLLFVNKDEMYHKTLANLLEVRARKDRVIAVTTVDTQVPEGLAYNLITIPAAHEAFQPILAATPFQLLKRLYPLRAQLRCRQAP